MSLTTLPKVAAVQAPTFSSLKAANLTVLWCEGLGIVLLWLSGCALGTARAEAILALLLLSSLSAALRVAVFLPGTFALRKHARLWRLPQAYLLSVLGILIHESIIAIVFRIGIYDEGKGGYALGGPQFLADPRLLPFMLGMALAFGIPVSLALSRYYRRTHPAQ